MITTDFVPGSPCWLDLGIPDIDAAAAFYRAVFGWNHRSFGPEAGGYGAFELDGRTVGALGPLSEEAARPAWTIYFTTEDADAAARSTEQLGGAVRTAPTDVGEAGRLAQLTDATGARFAVWQPFATTGLEATDEPGTLCWTELFTTDVDAAKDFYGALFGWRTQDMPLPGGAGAYSLISPYRGGQERMQGGMMRLSAEELAPVGGRPYWHPVFGSADCDATVAEVTAGRGSVQTGPEDVENVGRVAVCVDPWGADFVVLTPEES